MAPILPLLQTVFTSILEVFLICIAGYVLSRRGVLDKKTQKQINRLNVSLFTPALLFSKVAFTLTPAKLKELWVIPLFFVVVTTASMAVSYTLGRIFHLKPSQRSFAMAAAMFMNSNSLPIALMQSLVLTVSGLKWGDDDTKSEMLGRALTYLVLYSTMGMVLRWSYGVHLLTQADPESSENSPITTTVSSRQSSTPATPLSKSSTLDLSESGNTSHKKGPGIYSETTGLICGSATANKFFYSFPNTPQRSAIVLAPSPPLPPRPRYGSDASDDEPLSLPLRRATIPALDSPKSFTAKLRNFAKGVNEFMTVPLWAATASILVALIQPLQHILNEHSKPFKGALSAAGNCSIPLTLVVLGAYFYTPDDESKRLSTAKSRESLAGSIRSMLMLSKLRHQQPSQPTRHPGETKTVAIAVISRMVIVPLMLLPLMVLGAKLGLQKVFDDPVFVVANVLLISSPPALTLAQITQAASGDAFERLISRTVFWAYCIVTPPATIFYVVIGLMIAKM